MLTARPARASSPAVVRASIVFSEKCYKALKLEVLKALKPEMPYTGPDPVPLVPPLGQVACVRRSHGRAPVAGAGGHRYYAGLGVEEAKWGKQRFRTVEAQSAARVLRAASAGESAPRDTTWSCTQWLPGIRVLAAARTEALRESSRNQSRRHAGRISSTLG